MPTRLLSQNVNVSKSISKLTPMEEVLFIHLIVSVDDYGRFYGNPEILKGMLFPLRDFSTKQIESALQRLAEEGMIRRYIVDETEYIELSAWMKYQKPRAKASKFPGPDTGEQMVPDDNACKQKKPEEPVDDSPVMFELPLNTGDFHKVTENDVREYERLYPAVDVQQEIRSMIGWLNADRANLKTKKGIKRFIAGWLNRNQDRGARKNTNVRTVTNIIDGENPFR